MRRGAQTYRYYLCRIHNTLKTICIVLYEYETPCSMAGCCSLYLCFVAYTYIYVCRVGILSKGKRKATSLKH